MANASPVSIICGCEEAEARRSAGARVVATAANAAACESSIDIRAARSIDRREYVQVGRIAVRENARRAPYGNVYHGEVSRLTGVKKMVGLQQPSLLCTLELCGSYHFNNMSS